MAGEELMADEELPRDAKLVKSILRSMGVKQHEPRVVQQFLDFWYRYVVEVLGDAQLYSEHAGKQTIDCDDLKLSIQSRASFSFSQPPPREVWRWQAVALNPFSILAFCMLAELSSWSLANTLMELARIRNSVPLPKAISGPSIALPPEQDMLVAANYQISVPTKTVDDLETADGGNQTPTASGQTPATSAERNGMPPPASQHMDQDGSRKVSFSLAGSKRLHSQV